MDLGLNGRRALVTAASRGLGRACAEALVREGAQVFISSRDEATWALAFDCRRSRPASAVLELRHA